MVAAFPAHHQPPGSLELRAEGDGNQRHLFNGGQGFVAALYTIPTRKP